MWNGKNSLYYGDNLLILRDHIPAESVDLIYLDPPFNSSRTYNVLFKDESGHAPDAQVAAFEDTWHWNEATEALYVELVTETGGEIGQMVSALRQVAGRTSPMMAYIVMMTARLVELHRVLKGTGSLYLHCDSTASHYLKVILDTIFGPENFINEIIWKRTTAHGDAKQGSRHFGRITDTILFYTKSANYSWNQTYTKYDQGYLDSKYHHVEAESGRRYRLDNLTGPGGAAKGNPQYELMGVTRYWRYSKERMSQLVAEGRIIQTAPGKVPQYKRYLDEMQGQPLQALWTDIDPINSQAQERLGYQTQKPLVLLERIIQTSSNVGDVILDPFAGCGTAIVAAQKLNRRWIGIDVTHLAVALLKFRLKDSFDIEAGRNYDVVGEPVDLASARQLAEDDRYQFQWWALSLIGAKPIGSTDGKKGKKGADQGKDGFITFIDDNTNKAKQALVQVKSGKVKSSDIRDLIGTIQNENAAMGIFITLEKPSRDMITAAAAAGFYFSSGWQQQYPKIQIVTIEELLSGADVKMPPTRRSHKIAPKVESFDPDKPKQSPLGLE